MITTTDQTPTVAIVLNRDLMFGSRIRSALASLGLDAQFVQNTDDFVSALTERQETATIGIIDMNGPVSWNVIEEALARTGAALAPTLAFGPHVDVDNRRAAKAAGVTRIVSNGQFHADMIDLVERYRRH